MSTCDLMYGNHTFKVFKSPADAVEWLSAATETQADCAEMLTFNSDMLGQRHLHQEMGERYIAFCKRGANWIRNIMLQETQAGSFSI